MHRHNESIASWFHFNLVHCVGFSSSQILLSEQTFITVKIHFLNSYHITCVDPTISYQNNCCEEKKVSCPINYKVTHSEDRIHCLSSKNYIYIQLNKFSPVRAHVVRNMDLCRKCRTLTPCW